MTMFVRTFCLIVLAGVSVCSSAFAGGIAGDYIPFLPDTLDLTEDPANAAGFLHFYTSSAPMPTTQPNLDDEEAFCRDFLPDTLAEKLAFHVKNAIRYGYPDPPFSGIAGVAASWNDADSLTVAVLGWVGGPQPPVYLDVDTVKHYLWFPQPSETNDPDTLTLERSVICIAFTQPEKSKRAVRGDYTMGVASGPGGESEGDGIDIHHPDKSGKYVPGDSLIVCMGGETGEICVKIRAEASLSIEEAEEAIDEILLDIEENGEAMAYAIDYNNEDILAQKTPADMATFYKFGDAVCSEENNAQSCMYFTDGGSLGLPIEAWTQIRPASVNLSGPEMDFRVRLSPPEPFRAGNIDFETVKLYTELGSVRFDTDNEAQISTNHEGRVYAQFLFPWDDVETLLAVSDTYNVNCEFKIRETKFSGSDQIGVVNSLVMDSFARKKLIPQKTLAKGSDILFCVQNDGAEVTLEIFDVKGRLVRSLIKNPLPSGRHTYTWDGNDDSGQSVPSGLYFCRVKTGEMETSSKVFMIR